MVLVLLLALALIAPSLHAQIDVDVSLSGGAAFTNLSSTGFSPLPGITAPTDTLVYRGTNNFMWSVQPTGGVDVLGRFGGMRLGGGVRGSVYKFFPAFDATEQVPIAGDSGVFIATLGHHLTTDVSVLTIDPYIRVEPVSWFGLELGFSLAYPLQTSYTQTQKFLNPSGLTHIDGSVERVTARGELPGMKSGVNGIAFRTDWFVPIGSSGNGRLGVHLSVNQRLSSLHETADWRPTTFGAGIGVRLNIFGPDKQTIEPLRPTRSDTTRDTVVVLSLNVVEPRTELVLRSVDSTLRNDTIVYYVTERYRTLTRKPPSLLRVSVKVGFEQPDGSVDDDARLLSIRTQRTRVVPLLPAVMFDSGGARIPDRYRMLKQREALRWSEQQLVRDTSRHWQYNVLNVIGSRMKRTASSTVEVIAYDDGSPSSNELARQRAGSVQKYLVDAFKIPAQRLPLVVKTDPSRTQNDPSGTQNDPSGTQADPALVAPWVYLRDRTAAISGPISMRDTITESQLPKVRIVPEIVSEAGLASWSVQLVHRGRTLRTFADTLPTPYMVHWDMREDITMDAVLVAPVDVEISATDAEGTTVRGEPGRISLQGSAVTDASARLGKRDEVLIVQSLDNFRTSDAGMLPVPGEFRRIVIPREGGWFRRGLAEPELSLYRATALYIKEDRRP